jgi:PAS domain S-box-containing protein
MTQFVNRTLVVIGSAYLDAKEARLLEARRIAEERAEALSVSENALRRQTSILHSVFDSMAEGVIVCDEEGHYILFNQAGLRVTGNAGSAMDLQGPPPKGMVLSADGETPVPIDEMPLARARRGERVSDFEMILQTPQYPSGVRLSVNAAPWTDGSSALRGGVATFRDITDRAKMEEAQRHTRELQEQNQRIQTASRLKTEFLANMSHELRTPLHAIIGFADLLYEGQVPTDAIEQKQFLGNILRCGRHLLQLINDVLDVAKVESGTLEFHPRLVDIHGLVGEVVDILRKSAAEKQIQLSASVASEVRVLTVDQDRLKQICYNYLSNALKFTAAGGQVTVRVKPDGVGHFRLEVEDTGIGIREADLSRLFVDFQQLDTGPAKRYGGTGLGLALVKRIAEAQGGSAGACSKFGHGSTFYVRLPRGADPYK